MFGRWRAWFAKALLCCPTHCKTCCCHTDGLWPNPEAVVWLLTGQWPEGQRGYGGPCKLRLCNGIPPSMEWRRGDGKAGITPQPFRGGESVAGVHTATTSLAYGNWCYLASVIDCLIDLYCSKCYKWWGKRPAQRQIPMATWAQAVWACLPHLHVNWAWALMYASK